MERSGLGMAERVINHEMKERFTAGAVRRAVLLKHGDDPAIGPGQLMVRVFVEAADDEGLAAWQRDELAGHRRGARRRRPEARAYDVAYARALEQVLAMDDVPPPVAHEAREALTA